MFVMKKSIFNLSTTLGLLFCSFPALAMEDDLQTPYLRHRKSLAENRPEETALKSSLAPTLPIDIEVTKIIATFLCQNQKGLLKAAAVCHSWRAVAEKICNDPNQPYPKYLNLTSNLLFFKPNEYSLIRKFLICQYNLAAWAHGSDLMPIRPPHPHPIVYTSYMYEVDLVPQQENLLIPHKDMGDLFCQPKSYWLSGKFLKSVIEFAEKKKQAGRGGCVYFDVECDPFVLETNIDLNDYKEIEDCQLFGAHYSPSTTASWNIDGKIPYGKTFFLNFLGDESLD